MRECGIEKSSSPAIKVKAQHIHFVSQPWVLEIFLPLEVARCNHLLCRPCEPARMCENMRIFFSGMNGVAWIIHDLFGSLTVHSSYYLWSDEHELCFVPCRVAVGSIRTRVLAAHTWSATRHYATHMLGSPLVHVLSLCCGCRRTSCAFEHRRMENLSPLVPGWLTASTRGPSCRHPRYVPVVYSHCCVKSHRAMELIWHVKMRGPSCHSPECVPAIGPLT